MGLLSRYWLQGTSLSLYTYMYIYVYIYIYIHVYIYTCVYIYIHIYTSIYIYDHIVYWIILLYIHALQILNRIIYVIIYIYRYILLYILYVIHTYIHTYIHTHIHTCMHTLHYITLHYITSHHITSHYITLHYLHINMYIYIYTLLHIMLLYHVHMYIYIYILYRDTNYIDWKKTLFGTHTHTHTKKKKKNTVGCFRSLSVLLCEDFTLGFGCFQQKGSILNRQPRGFPHIVDGAVPGCRQLQIGLQLVLGAAVRSSAVQNPVENTICGFPWPWGYPYLSSIYRWIFRFSLKKETSIGGTPMAMETTWNHHFFDPNDPGPSVRSSHDLSVFPVGLRHDLLFRLVVFQFLRWTESMEVNIKGWRLPIHINSQ